MVWSWKHARWEQALDGGKKQVVVVVVMLVKMMIRQERCGPALGSQIATGWSEGEKPEPGRNSKRKGAEDSNRGSPDGGSGGREEEK